MRSARLEIEPLAVVERRHIDAALAACNGNVTQASKLLGIGRSTLFRKRQQQDSDLRGNCHVRIAWPDVEPPKEGVLDHRQRVERTIESHGGHLPTAAMSLGVSSQRVCYSLRRWHVDNELHIRKLAEREGISDDEIEVMLRRRTMREHADRCGFCVTTAYGMIDQACAIVGLRRYRSWLFLA